MEASGQIHTPAALPPGKESQYLLKEISVGSNNHAWRSGRKKIFLRHFRILPRNKWAFRSSGMLCSTDWLLVTTMAKISEDTLPQEDRPALA